jgi:Raf kinase inhibitor-like YbhB/YbcL family protein
MRRTWLSLGAVAAIFAPATPALALTLSSHDLTPGGVMPAAQIYPRCGGQNVSPSLAWKGAPAATKSFALTMIDLDVKPAFWSHWVVVDLPPSASSLPRGLKALPAGARAVVSNFGDAAYDGPCPPPGTGVHHYQITVWALPAAAVTAAPDEPADTLMTELAAASLVHASLTVTATARGQPTR